MVAPYSENVMGYLSIKHNWVNLFNNFVSEDECGGCVCSVFGLPVSFNFCTIRLSQIYCEVICGQGHDIQTDQVDPVGLDGAGGM